MSNLKVFKVREVIINELDDFMDGWGSLPSYLEEIDVIYNHGTKKYLDRKGKVVWIEHRGRAFAYKDHAKEYYQCQWEFNNIDDTFILPDRTVNALEIISNSGIRSTYKSVNDALFRHYHSKKCRDLRRGI